MDHTDGSTLRAKLKEERKYKTINLGRLEDPDAIADLERYQVGDLIRVPRSGSRASMGVVIGKTAAGELRVEVETHDGKAGQKEMPADQVREMNPLKIGDHFTFQGRPFWVEGVDEVGDLVVVSDDRQRFDAYLLADKIRRELDSGSEKTVRVPSMSDDAKRAALRNLPEIGDHDPTIDVSSEIATYHLMAEPAHDDSSTIKTPALRPASGTKKHYTPIEAIVRADTLHGLIAGNRETNTIYDLQSPLANAALHTNRGHHYKDWNEDGGALFADRAGRLYVGVFDQAGGEGSDKNARGAASKIAAQSLFDRMKAFADTHGDAKRAEEALINAALDAHQLILARGRHEVTTFLGAMIEKNLAVIVNVGDSGAMHFSPEGDHLDSTEEQGIGNLLLEGLGKHYSEGHGPDCRGYHWRVTHGEYLVFGSDGLLDTKLSRDEIGAIIARAGSAADATRALRDIVSQRMKMKAGKPDNLTILVVRVGEDL
jgi:serine/threonine protein phosphatase PrpC